LAPDLAFLAFQTFDLGFLLLRRREVMEAQGLGSWKPVDRNRRISGALQAYSALATSASRGAVRDVSGLRR